MQKDIARILLHETTILSRLDAMAADITSDYQSRELTVIAVLNGSLVFMADLLRRLPIPLQIDGLTVASYVGTQSTGRVEFLQTRMPDVVGRHVLILDDILDSGRTLAGVTETLKNCEGVLSVATCVLLQKEVEHVCEIKADYVGFRIEDEFVVGYGLDYNERYRNLPFIGVLRPEAIERYAET
ncbi:MAG: hypoxanthine phosphoribosyltransferase [Chthoniobacterales bacterium]